MYFFPSSLVDTFQRKDDTDNMLVVNQAANGDALCERATLAGFLGLISCRTASRLFLTHSLTLSIYMYIYNCMRCQWSFRGLYV